jgi:hypothetical protein
VLPTLEGFTFVEQTAAEKSVLARLSPGVAGVRMVEVHYRGTALGGIALQRRDVPVAAGGEAREGIDAAAGFVGATRATPLHLAGHEAWTATREEPPTVDIAWVDGTDTIVVWAKNSENAKFIADAYVG